MRFVSLEKRTKHWGLAWVFLAVAIALHVTDEALTGFLPLYNTLVESLRESYRWVPLPTFSFRVWLSGLVIAVLLLLGLAPFVFAGRTILRPLAYVLSVLMISNALVHIGASLYWQKLAPGTLSSPVLLLAAVTLLITTHRARHITSPCPRPQP